MPALINVRPVYAFSPESIKVPLPDFVKAPLVDGDEPLIVNTVLETLTSTVPVVPLVSVNPRSVDTVTPVYLRVPPLNTRFEGKLLEDPMPLFVEPSPSVLTLRVPLLIVVTPV